MSTPKIVQTQAALNNNTTFSIDPLSLPPTSHDEKGKPTPGIIKTIKIKKNNFSIF